MKARQTFRSRDRAADDIANVQGFKVLDIGAMSYVSHEEQSATAINGRSWRLDGF